MARVWLLTCALLSSLAILPTRTSQAAGTEQWEFSRPSIRPDDIDVQCLTNGINVVIDKDRLLAAGHGHHLIFYFLDFTCESVDNGTHITTFTNFDACGTVKEVSSRGVVYSNEFRSKDPPGLGDEHLRCPVIAVRFSCYYGTASMRAASSEKSFVKKDVFCSHLLGFGPNIEDGIVKRTKSPARKIVTKQRVLSCPTVVGIGEPLSEEGVLSKYTLRLDGGIRVKSKSKICRPLQQNGDLDLKLILFSDPNYTELIASKRDGHPGGQFVDVFYELVLEGSDPFLKIFPTTCYATPTSDKNDPLQYIFLKDGCALDETFQFHSAPSGRTSRFSLTSFRFQQSSSNSFYVHCEVSICDTLDQNSLCQQRCHSSFRTKRRAIIPMTLYDEVRELADYKGLNVTCKLEKITIAVDKSVVERKAASSLRLIDRRCKPLANGTHFVFSYLPGKCGSTLTVTQGEVIYRNVLRGKASNPSRAESGREIVVPITCRFPFQESNEIVSAPQLQVPTSVTGRLSPLVRLNTSLARKNLLVNFANNVVVLTKIIVPGELETNSSTKDVVKVHANLEEGHILRVTFTSGPNLTSFRSKQCYMSQWTRRSADVMLVTNYCPNAEVEGFSHERSGFAKEVLEIDMNNRKLSHEEAYLTCVIEACDASRPPCRFACPERHADRNRQRRSTKETQYEVHLKCNSDTMTLSIEKRSLPRGAVIKNMHLLDPTCRATENATHVVVVATASTCGTKSQDIDDQKFYINALLEDAPNELIIRRALVQLPFKCAYKFEPISAGLSIRFASPVVKFSTRAIGHYSVRIEMFADDSYLQPLSQSIAEVDPGKPMFFKVKIVSERHQLSLKLDKCFGRPYQGADPKDHYTFIKNGCAVDTTVKFHTSPRPDEVRFSLKPFSFSDEPTESVVINCYVSACDQMESGSSCSKGCDSDTGVHNTALN